MLFRILKLIKTKYYIATVAFVVWITFFDSNSLILQARLSSQLNDLKREKQFYLDEINEKCKLTIANNSKVNHVNEIYAPFSYEQISVKIAEIVKPPNMKSEVEIIYQTVENLHKAIPNHLGDWYFTGNFPTPGGNRVVNQAFVNFMAGKLVRAY